MRPSDLKWLAALVLVGASPAFGASLTGLYPTGVNNSSVLLAVGSQDPHYTIVTSADGTLTAARVVIRSDEGAYASTGPAVLRKAVSHCTGPYRVPNVHCDGVALFTNNCPTGAMSTTTARAPRFARTSSSGRADTARSRGRFEMRGAGEIEQHEGIEAVAMVVVREQ